MPTWPRCGAWAWRAMGAMCRSASWCWRKCCRRSAGAAMRNTMPGRNRSSVRC
ncbi:Uncharacterised protein [Bordetella pertussis]|nr:Uncharacterised protein [Bordetella pertussis]